MSVRVDPGLIKELGKYGGETAVKCMNCGNCTAVCSLSGEENVFPRKYIRYLQLGLKDRMLESVDPWLCYYCGDCGDTCPRDADPCKVMMAGRRWLTSMYDWTGLSRLMYEVKAWELIVLALVSAGVLLLFTLPENFGFRLLAQHPEARQAVNLAYFAPKGFVHIGDIILAALLGGFLLSNAGRMYHFAMRHGPSIPLRVSLSQAKEFVIQGLLQKRWTGCDAPTRKHWLRHLVLVTGYGTMLLLVVVFLPWFQVQDASFHWTSLLGYYATLVLFSTISWIIYERLQKKCEQIHRHSDLGDWLFLILLLLTTLSGILLHLARLSNLPMATYVMYTVHMMIAVPMLVVEVPFGKWAHLFYRPLAAYIAVVKLKAGHLGQIYGAPVAQALPHAPRSPMGMLAKGVR
jgi:ferredoxin